VTGVVQLVAQALVAGGLTGARPMLTLFVLGLATRFSHDGALPDDVAFLVHPYGLVVLGALSFVEHELRDDPDIEELLRWVLAAVGAVAAAFSARLLSAVSGGGVDAGWPTVVGATVASLAVQRARQHALSSLDELATLGGWWRRVEAGGVIGLLLLLWALPFLALGLVVVLTLLAVAAGWTLRRYRRTADARRRQPCPHCQAPIRIEASLCPECRVDVAPRGWLTAGTGRLPRASSSSTT